MDAGDDTTGPAGNLLRSLVRLAGSLLAAAETRVDLLATELEEDAARGLRLLGWAVGALMTAILGVLMAGVTLIILFWETHRMAVAGLVTLVFLVAAAVCASAFQRCLSEKPRVLDATRTELKKDLAAIRSRR
jgi:uncharacterized membrane protein YqjE